MRKREFIELLAVLIRILLLNTHYTVRILAYKSYHDKTLSYEKDIRRVKKESLFTRIKNKKVIKR